MEAAFHSLALEALWGLWGVEKLIQARQRLAFARCGHLSDIDVMVAVCAALPHVFDCVFADARVDLFARVERESIVKAKKAKRWGRVAAVGKAMQGQLQDMGFGRSAAPAAPEADREPVWEEQQKDGDSVSPLR